MQHDSPVGLAAGEGPVGIPHGCEWVGCGDGDVKIAGSGEVSQPGQRGKASGIGRPERLDALVLRAAVVDNGVDPLARHVQCECEIDVTAANRVDERMSPVLPGCGADALLLAFAVLNGLDAVPPEQVEVAALVRPITVAPARTASCAAVKPTPPDAPEITTVSPGRGSTALMAPRPAIGVV